MQTLNSRKQRGFTLVELLVVIGIIAVLAAVVIPNVARFVGRGDEEANNAEADTVQAAMDLAIADNRLNPPIVDQATVLCDFSSTGGGDIGVNPDTAATIYLYPQYLRTDLTKMQYTWDVNGIVTQASTTCP